jgi:hypothetical protein
MQNVRELAELYGYLSIVADNYSRVAAVNRLETLGLTVAATEIYAAKQESGSEQPEKSACLTATFRRCRALVRIVEFNRCRQPSDVR